MIPSVFELIETGLDAADGSVGLVAWPVAAAGSVLVGEGKPERLSGALAR